jgi:hypothetical protein
MVLHRETVLVVRNWPRKRNTAAKRDTSVIKERWGY